MPLLRRDIAAKVNARFRRDTPAPYTGADGQPATAPAGVPRIDHDPVTLEPLGLLLEPSSAGQAADQLVTVDDGWADEAAGAICTLLVDRTPRGGVAQRLAYFTRRPAQLDRALQHAAGHLRRIKVYARQLRVVDGVVSAGGKTWTVVEQGRLVADGAGSLLDAGGGDHLQEHPEP